MKKILILVAEFGNQSVHPCGKDMHFLSQELSKEDVCIKVLTRGSKFDMLSSKVSVDKLSTILENRDKLCDKFLAEKRRIPKFLLRVKLHFWDRYIDRNNISKTRLDLRELKKWLNNEEEKYDLLISVSYPFYIQEFAHIIQKELKIKKWIAYLLDPHADNQVCPQRQRNKRVKQEKKLFKKCTDIFTVEESVSQANYSPITCFSNKIQYIPTHLIGDNTHYHTKNETDFVHFVYTGLFYPDIRNPENLLRYFTRLPDNYILHLYSRGCNSIIDKYKEVLGDRLQANGYILDAEEYNKMIGRADFLVDVGNTVSNQVPSKILTYCSFGKPIIHFKNCEDEVIGDKFAEYPLFSVIDYAEDIERVTKEIETSVKMHFGETVPYQEIKNNFSECTVEYVAEKIKNILGEL